MRTLALSAMLAVVFCGEALAWGQEGHSIVAEIAQRRLSPEAARAVEQLLGRGHSLASVASWADDVRDARPETFNWHFVDIPLAVRKYNAARDCAEDAKSGFCIVAELDALRNDVRCASGGDQVEALKFAVHFVGDIHQPLHTVHEAEGGNDIKVDLFMRGQVCGGTCEPGHIATNFHAAWDFGLIEKVVFDWGAYVDRLEDGWLKSPEATRPGIDGGTFVDWAEETHALAPIVWNGRRADDVLDDRYLREVQPILDRQLGVAGLRLAKFLNEAFNSRDCPVR
jgi:S1/P1 Nuclease